MRKGKPNCICKTGLFCLLMWGFIHSLKGQEFDKDYMPLQSSGTIPDVFLKSARAQSAYEMAIIPLQKDKIENEQFIKGNNYFIEDLLLSGQVLINDPLTTYVNKVAVEVTKQNPAFGALSVQLFVTKSPEVNAYAFDRGLIFVNIGLLAQLENEAQLAYILSHELVHVAKKHSIKEYIKNQRLEKDENYDKTEEDDLLLTAYRFSKEQEREADVEGLKLIKNTNYSVKAVMGAFDVMQYSYLPFELPEFKKSFFEDEYLKIPDTLNLKEVSAIGINDNYDDSKSTHPNIRKRRLSIVDDINAITETGRKKYLVSEETFKTIREIARFELCRIYLLKRDYANAIYGAYILLKKYPDNLYLKKIVGKGMYNIAVNKVEIAPSNVITIRKSSDYSVDDYRTIEGESQRLYYLLENLNAKEISTIALSYVYKAEKQYPNDKVLSILEDSLLSCLVHKNGLYLDRFSKKTQKEEQSDTTKPIVVKVEEEEETKYTTIKKIQASADPIDDGFIKYALVGLLKDDAFVKRYEQRENKFKDDYAGNESTKKESSEDEMFGVDKVILLDPNYRRVQEDDDAVKIKYEESEEQQLKLIEIQKKCAELLKLNYVNISMRNLTATDIEKYNEAALINEWLAERSKHGNSDEIMECSESVKEIIQKKGTKYMVLSGVYNSNNKNSAYFFMLLNLETGKIMRAETKEEEERDSDELLNKYVQNSLMHVIKRPKN
jgi:hypothetical protein